MSRLPTADIQPVVSSFLSVYLQNPRNFETSHIMAEKSILFYQPVHQAIEESAGTVLGSLSEAVVIGVKVFETLDAEERDRDTYIGSEIIQAGIATFLQMHHTTGQFEAGISVASQRLQEDTPLLFDATEQIIDHYLAPDQIAIKWAIGGAGIMRSMQIYLASKLPKINMAGFEDSFNNQSALEKD